MKNTKIEWADHTWNPWRGCTKVSPGCAHCYAEALSKRNPAVLGQWGQGAPRVLAKNWSEPYRWNDHPRVDDETNQIATTMVFPSLCDWLDEEVPIEWLARFLELIHATPNLTWLLLTKRPQNWWRVDEAWRVGNLLMPAKRWLARWHDGNPPANVWLGVSVEDQPRAVERIPRLLMIPAALRWLSLEPLLGPVDLTHLDLGATTKNWCQIDALTGRHTDMSHPCLSVPKVDWLVIGGESGPRARPCNIQWIRNLVRDGQGAGVDVFVKQVGACPVTTMTVGQDHDDLRAFSHPKGGDPDEWPSDLRVRQWPVGCPR